MKVLMISTDSNILEEGSNVRARMAEYGTICDELHIVLASVGGKKDVLKVSDNVFVHPTASCCRLFSRLSLFSPQNFIFSDIVTAQDPFETGFAAWYISRRIGAKLELQIHTDFLNPYFRREYFINRIRVLIAKLILPRADVIRVVSQRVADSLKTQNLKLKTSPVVLPVFVDIEKIKNAVPSENLHKKYPQFDFVILMASRLTKEKNINLAIEAMSKIVSKHPRAGLVIAGSGPEKDNLILKTNNLKLDKNIIFEDWIEDIISYYKTADCFLSTSNYEGFGLSLIEAAASGCPVVATDVGIVGNILKNGENALVCSAGDKHCVERQIKRLIEFPESRFSISKNAQNAVGSLIIDKKDYLECFKKTWYSRAVRLPPGES